MNRLKEMEHAPAGTRLTLDELIAAIPFDTMAPGAAASGGLIAAIAQQIDSGEVLMLGWMNEAALRLTLSSGQVTYYSRSRQALWRKGERSGQVQQLRGLRLDCDGDALLVLVDQQGPACHTGRRDCFYWHVDASGAVLSGDVLIDPDALYGDR